MTSADTTPPHEVLAAYDELSGLELRRFGAGLINDTFVAVGPSAKVVVQRVNRIFPAVIHENIHAVTCRLAERGLATPRLVATRDGKPCVEHAGEVFRVMTFVEGVSFDVVGSLGQARAAGRLVGRFHAATDDLPHRFVGMRAGVHDTPKHLERLREALTRHHGHRLSAGFEPVARELLARAEELPPLPALADRVCHGDLKFNNLLFEGTAGAAAETPVCLIDLDTVGPMSLSYELGDAWRSWCNRAGENEPEALLDLDILDAALTGYEEGVSRALSGAERQAVLLGVEWVSLELAARFAADAVFETYFGWDPKRFSGRGEHNLVRAQGQLSLHRAFVASRAARAERLALEI